MPRQTKKRVTNDSDKGNGANCSIGDSSKETPAPNGKRNRCDKTPAAAVDAKKPSDDSETKDFGNLPLLFRDSKAECGYCNKSYSIFTLVKHHWTERCVGALEAKAAATTKATSIASDTYIPLSPEGKVKLTADAKQIRNKIDYQKRKWKEILHEVINEYEEKHPKPKMQQISTNYVYPSFLDHKCKHNCELLHKHWKCNPFFVPKDTIKKASQKEIKDVLLSLRNSYKQIDKDNFWTKKWFNRHFILALHPDKHRGMEIPLKTALVQNINSYNEMFDQEPEKNMHSEKCVDDVKQHFLRVTENIKIVSDEETFDLAVAKWEKEKNEYIDGWQSKGHTMWKNRANNAEAAVEVNKTVGAEGAKKEEIDLVSTSSDESTPPRSAKKNKCCAGEFCVYLKNYHKVQFTPAMCGLCWKESHLQCQQIHPITLDIKVCMKCANEVRELGRKNKTK